MREKLGNLQALRGIAALTVVLFHASDVEFYRDAAFQPLRPFRWFGFAGVDLFFVLSGFVIAYAHRDWFGSVRRVPTFAVRRVWRIYPTYWAILFLSAAWFWLYEKHKPLGHENRAAFWRALSLAPEHFWIQTWVGQAWTLSYELAFYGAFAVLLPLPRRWAGAVLVAWFGAVIALNLKTTPPANRFSILFGGPLVIEFLLGAAIGWKLRPGWGQWSGAMLVAAVGWLAVAFTWTYNADPKVMYPTQALRVLVWGMPCALILAAFASADLRGRWPLPRRLQQLGEASYSIYLVHMLTMAMLVATWKALDIGNTIYGHTIWLGILMASAIGCGLLMYRYVELPCVNLMKRWTKKSPPAKPVAAPAPAIERRAA